MLGCDRDVPGTTGHTADGFAVFFHRKVDDVRASTAAAFSLQRCSLNTVVFPLVHGA